MVSPLSVKYWLLVIDREASPSSDVLCSRPPFAAGELQRYQFGFERLLCNVFCHGVAAAPHALTLGNFRLLRSSKAK